MTSNPFEQSRTRVLCVASIIVFTSCAGNPQPSMRQIQIVEPILVPSEEGVFSGPDSSVLDFAYHVARAELVPGEAYNVMICAVSEVEVLVTFIPVDLSNPFQLDVRVKAEVGEPYTIKVQDKEMERLQLQP